LTPSEIIEIEPLDAQLDALYGTRLMPEFQVELASGFISLWTLKIRSSKMQMQFISYWQQLAIFMPVHDCTKWMPKEVSGVSPWCRGSQHSGSIWGRWESSWDHCEFWNGPA
jgi:hypothetical protein